VNFNPSQEPAVYGGLVAAVIAAAVTFGLHLSTEQIGAIMAVVTIALGFLVRANVTPTAAAVPPTPPQVLTPPKV
jgi:hypothetical protein